MRFALWLVYWLAVVGGYWTLLRWFTKEGGDRVVVVVGRAIGVAITVEAAYVLWFVAQGGGQWQRP